jgi:hypothetical protein
MTPRSSLALVLAAAIGVSGAARAEATKPSPEPPPNYLRPALEIAIGLGAGAVWYVLDDRNVLDFDYPSLKQRLNGEAWRFDSNRFPLNYVWHPLTGAGMYVLSRGNRLGVVPAFAYALAGSTAWEYVIEFNEKISVNDMIVTPLAGLALGEFFHKLALYVSRPAPRGVGGQALAWSLGLSVHGHDRLDGIEPEAPEQWRALELAYGFGVTTRGGEAARGAHRLGFSGRLVSLPGYLEPSAGGRWFADADVAAFDLDLELGAEGVGADVFAETWLAGYHEPALAATGALAVGYTYRSTRAFGFDDRQGLLRFPGVAAEFQRRRGELGALLRARGAPTFGSMSAVGYPSFRLAEPEGRAKTVLERESYFYGWGFSAGLEARLRLGALGLGGELGVSRLASIEGFDRAQERVARDLHVRETALDYGFSASVQPSGTGLRGGLVVERRKRVSMTSSVETRTDGERLLVELALPL